MEGGSAASRGIDRGSLRAESAPALPVPYRTDSPVLDSPNHSSADSVSPGTRRTCPLPDDRGSPLSLHCDCHGSAHKLKNRPLCRKLPCGSAAPRFCLNGLAHLPRQVRIRLQGIRGGALGPQPRLRLVTAQLGRDGCYLSNRNQAVLPKSEFFPSTHRRKGNWVPRIGSP